MAQAIEAMGGGARLASLKSLTLDSIGHGWALEQSERPEGPWLTTYRQVLEIRDYEHQRRAVQTQRRNWSFPTWSNPGIGVFVDGLAAQSVTTPNGTRWLPGPPFGERSLAETLALSPERVLLTARDAKDLRVLPDEVQQRVRQRALGFTFEQLRVRLLLNAWTNLPTMLEVVRHDSIWGDVTEQRWFSFWTLEKGGLLYPRQTSVTWNGFTYTDDTVQGLKADEPVDETKFAIPADVRAAAATQASGMPSLHVDESRVVAITDWILQVPGGFNVALVRQPDGLVVIEATSSSDYSAEVLALAAKRFPGVPVKAVVTTSDAWPHLAGIREYVARRIPIYPLDLNVSILTRLIESRRTFAPDALAKQPRPPIFRPVSSKTVIGSGDTRIELIPVRGETGERMMIAWLPGAKALYSSDLIQRLRAGTFFMPEMLLEVQAAVSRERIDGIDRAFGMHLLPTPWQAVVDAIAAARAP